MTPDVNLLVACALPGHEHHAPAHRWLAQACRAAGNGTALTLLPMVLAGFLHVSTSPIVFANPMTPDEAVNFVDDLLDRPGVSIADLGAEWPLLRQLCQSQQLRGNIVADAWVAACVVQLAEHLVTFDRDFKKLLPRSRLTVLST